MTMAEMITRAQEVSEKLSDCQSRNVGAIIVDRDKVGFAVGYTHSTGNCRETGCPRKKAGFKSGEGLEHCLAIHAEVDAINRCERLGIDTNLAHIHVTLQPCNDCARAIIKAGIRSVSYCEPYANSNSVTILEEAGITVLKVGE